MHGCHWIFVLALTAPDGVPTPGVALPKEQFLAEYPAALDEMASRYSRFSGSARVTEHRGIGSPNETTQIYDVEFARTKDGVKLVSLEEAATTAEVKPLIITDPKTKVTRQIQRMPRSYGKAYIYNKNYSLEMTKEGHGTPWIVKRYDPTAKNIKPSTDQDIRMYYAYPVTSGGALSRIHFNSPAFKVEDVKRESGPGGKSLLRVEFSFNRKTTSTSASAIMQSGALIVSPEEHWALYGFEKRSRFTKHVGLKVETGRIDFEDGTSDLPIPKRLTVKSFLRDFDEPGDKLTSEDIVEFKKLAFETVPPREFTAEAFGLPEMNKPSNRSYTYKTGYWFAGLAAVAFACAIFLRYYATRPSAGAERRSE